ncbi:DUF3570 domain-containing protein, partial [candidate division CSSED10-310 bacterium]
MQLRSLLRKQFGLFIYLISLWPLNTVTGHEVSLRYQYFKDDGSTVTIPGIDVSVETWEGGTMTGSVSADTVTAASEHRKTDVDTVTSASDYEHRFQATLGFNQQWRQWSFLLGSYYSDEPDYTSTAFFGGLARDFFQRNTTVSIHGNYGYDDISSSEDPDFREQARRFGGTLSLTQVLTPKMISRVAASYSYVSGYQSSPYRYALRSSVSPEFNNQEVLPDERNRYAFYTRINIYNEKAKGAIHPAYRFYWDDWGIYSHEFDLKFYKYLFSSLIIHLELRYYVQSEADYYQELWSESDRFMTSYEKYAAGNTYLIAMGS